MCLGVPGRIEQITDDHPIMRTGTVRFGGISKAVNLAFVEDAGIGDYVIVHAGFAISKIDEEEANRVFEYLKEMGEVEEISDVK